MNKSVNILSRTDRAFRGMLTAILQFGAQVALQLLLAPIVLKYSGQETLGVYSIIGQAIAFASLLETGFSIALGRYLPQAYGRADFNKLLITGRSVNIIIGFICGSLIFLISFCVGSLFSISGDNVSQAELSLRLLSVWIVLRSPWGIFNAALIATQNIASSNIISLISNIIRFSLATILIIRGYGLLALIISNIFAEILALFLSRWRFKKIYSLIPSITFYLDKSLAKKLLVFAGSALVLHMGTLIILSSDNIIVGYLFGATMSAVYYSTQMPSTLCYLLINRLTDSATPGIHEIYIQNDKFKLKNLFLKLHRYTFFLSLPSAMGLILFQEKFTDLWVGINNYAGIEMTYVLAIFLIVITTCHVNNAFIMARGKIKPLRNLLFIEAIINLILSLYLGKKLGLYGVMLATLLSSSITTSYYMIATLPIVKVHYKDIIKAAVGPLIGTCFASIIILILDSISQIWNTPVNFLFLATVFLVTYFLYLYKFTLHQSEKVKILELIKRLI